MSDSKDLKVLVVASEITPFAKSGGLGDVIGSLPKALKHYGVDIRVVVPKYHSIKKEYAERMSYVDSLSISLDWRNQTASIFKMEDEIPIYFLGNDYYFGRDSLYGYDDDCERFSFFAKASVACLTHIDFIPDVIHYNDWQTGLGCVHLHDTYGGISALSNIKTLFTIHNIQYQGVFNRDLLRMMGLNEGYCNVNKMEFHGNVSMMKAALIYADAISTVSETYANEIQTPEYSYGLDGVLRKQSHKLYGIVNGIDEVTNNPATDKRIFENYDSNSLHIKKNNKRALQEQLGLPQKDVPIIAIISRLVEQKGLDLIAVAMEELIGKDIQLVVLGTGESRYENLFKHMAWRSPDKVSANICFSDELAQRIYAGSDLFLMPSLFEPCGLGQLFAMRYGTIPIVRRTGGLADTVQHYDKTTKQGNGFVFNDYLANGMMWAVNEALHCYYLEDWNNVVQNAISSDFSWDKSAEKYIELYLKLKDGE